MHQLPSTGASAQADQRPKYRVAVFGLGQKFQRLLEIVIRHARHNQYQFVIAGSRGPGEFDIAMVDMTAKGGLEVANTLRKLPQARPVVTVGRRSDPVRGCDDLLQMNFTMHLLQALNAAVERQLARRKAQVQAAVDGVVASFTGAPEARPAVQRRPRALVVDDSPTVCRQLVLALSQMGIDADSVSSAQEAIDTLSLTRYDLVFADVVMPEVDGYKLTREIKRDRATRAIPVVILTTRSSPFDLARGALAGCNSYLVKPVSLQSLRETVMRHLKKQMAAGEPLAELSPA